LGGDSALLANGTNAVITTSGAINSDSAANRALNITANGTGSRVSLGRAIGDNNSLSQVSVTSGSIALNGGTVNTSGNQTYSGAVTLGSNTNLAASGNAAVITTNGTINSDHTARSLNITASGTNSAVVLNGAIGNETALDNLAVTAGALALSAGAIDTRGNQTYVGPITLTKDTTLQSFGADSSIAMTQSINGDSSTARSFNISASGTGSTVTLGGSVGSTFSLRTLDVTGDLINMQAGTVNSNAPAMADGGICSSSFAAKLHAIRYMQCS
jgi:hypothetical protein